MDLHIFSQPHNPEFHPQCDLLLSTFIQSSNLSPMTFRDNINYQSVTIFFITHLSADKKKYTSLFVESFLIKLTSNNQFLQLMESIDETHQCRFLCFKLCTNNGEQEETKKLSKFASFEKLSLKKMKDNNYHMNRSQSYKRIGKPIPTTQRSGEEGAENHLMNLIQMKKQVECELNTLNNDFDKYYDIYNKKLKQLKDLQIKMNPPIKEKWKN